MMVAVPAFAKSLKNEAEYKKEWCAKYNGEVDYKTHDKTTVDCITDTHAIEFEYGKNWNPAIRKSRQQSMSVGKTPGVVLILENSKDKKD